MSIRFLQYPGPYERQLQRKYRNPLFGEDSSQTISQQTVVRARGQDEAALKRFLLHFQDLVQEAVDLKPNADSELILDIKERLDQCYSQCCTLPGEHGNIKSAIDKLIAVIMEAIRQGAANDPLALQKLDEEDLAREMHKKLHNSVLVADLLSPDSPVAEDELIPTLLSEPSASLETALSLFEHEHLQLMYKNGKNLLQDLQADGKNIAEAWRNLKLFEAALLKTPEDDKQETLNKPQ